MTSGKGERAEMPAGAERAWAIVDGEAIDDPPESRGPASDARLAAMKRALRVALDRSTDDYWWLYRSACKGLNLDERRRFNEISEGGPGQ